MMCKNCIYYDKFKSELESKMKKKKVIYCNYQGKAIEIKQAKKITHCDVQYPEKPD